MGMFQGFNQASRSAAPNLLAANAADERAEAAKRQQITNLALGAASLASPFLMPAAAAKTALDVKDYMQIANQLRTAGATGAGATGAGATGAGATGAGATGALRNNFFSPVDNSI